jgi:hypothetical protein
VGNGTLEECEIWWRRILDSSFTGGPRLRKLEGRTAANAAGIAGPSPGIGTGNGGGLNERKMG